MFQIVIGVEIKPSIRLIRSLPLEAYILVVERDFIQNKNVYFRLQVLRENKEESIF